MIVLGIDIPPAVLELMEASILEGGHTFRDIASIATAGLREAGVRVDVADRAADRLLQLHRKRGTIRFVAGRWRLTGSAHQGPQLLDPATERRR